MKRIHLLVCTLLFSVPAVAEIEKLVVNDNDWPSYGRTDDQSHYSPLTDITPSNIAQLGLEWSYDISGKLLPLSEPLVVKGTLYFATSYSVIRAIDAASGRMLWLYDPDVGAKAGSSLLGGRGIRGIAFWRDRIYCGAQDGRLISIDAKTGTMLWSVQTFDPKEGRHISGPPIVFNGKVMIGNGGAERREVRGYVTTYDALTGQQLWRFYTVPGNPAMGFENRAMEMAAKTWSGQWWKLGGGATVWNAMTFDPELNRVYVGTGNGSPWNQRMRSPHGGDNLFVASIVALDANTGEYIWHYQVNPADVLDYDAAADIELAHLHLNGTSVRVIMQASKNGFFYVINRDTGRLISAAKFAKVTWATKVDLSTGRPVETATARYRLSETTVWPGSIGAHGVQPMAFNPVTGLVYIPVQDLPGWYSDKDIDARTWRFDPNSGESNLGVSIDLRLPPDMSVSHGISSLLAWDPVRQRAAWRVSLPGVSSGGIATTAANLVFQGRRDRRFVAYAADTGKQLWSFDTQSSSISAPIVYRVGGRQQVSVIAGSGGWSTPPQRLLTFGLNGRSRLPATQHRDVTPIADPTFASNAEAEQGGAKAFDRCARCHGKNAVSTGEAPDLRESGVIISPGPFRSVVKGGLRMQGMPPFPGLSDAEIENIRQFVRSRAHALSTGEVVR